MSETRIYLLRHGVTDWNSEGRWQGQTDIPLNEFGLAQASCATTRLASWEFAKIYSSDLKRALTTAQAVAAQLETEVSQTEAWRERHAGDFQGLTSAEIAEKFPEAFAEMQQGHLNPVNGELFPDFAERIRKELDRILQIHAGEQILVVSHGGTIRAAAAVAMGLPREVAWGFSVGNTALSCLAHSNRGWRLELWNDTSHLDSELISAKPVGFTL